MTDRRTLYNVVFMLAASDLALIALHLLTGADLVHLDREANLASWYQSAKLLAIALLSASVYLATPVGGLRRPWLLNALLFGAMSLDETASLHERLARRLLELPALEGLRDRLTGGDELKASFAWVWLLMPLILAAAGFLIYLCVRSFRGQRAPLLLFCAGLALLLTAVGFEGWITAFPAIEQWQASEARRYAKLATVEECAELFGATLLFAAVAIHRVRLREAGR